MSVKMIHQWFYRHCLGKCSAPQGGICYCQEGKNEGDRRKKTCRDVAVCVTCCLGDFLYGLMDLTQTSLLIPVVSVFAQGLVS